MNDSTYFHLHDRFSRGEALSDAELQMLQEWYAQQDAEESAQINQAATSADTTEPLQQQIAQTALHLQTVTQHISSTIAANEALRKEIAALQARLAQQVPGRAA